MGERSPWGAKYICRSTSDRGRPRAAPAGANFSGGGIFYQGETATVRAVNDAYNEFDEWQEDGRTVSRDIEYSFTVDRDRRLLAVFEPLDDGKLGVVGRGLIGSARIGRRGA